MHLNFFSNLLPKLSTEPTEEERSMTTFYYCSVNHQSGLQRKNIFKIIIYFFNTSKCAANYVISFAVYDGFICQKVLKLWRQESWPFGPDWSANITRISSLTFHFPRVRGNFKNPDQQDMSHQKCLHFSNKSVEQRMHAGLATGWFQVKILSEPPTCCFYSMSSLVIS